MRANNMKFNLENSVERIDSILKASNSYDEVDDIPKIVDLTFDNGKYVNCAAIFIDLRGSTDLIESQGRQSRTLAKLYRAYISEMVAIVNSFDTSREINIVGDCVSAIFSGETSNEDESPVIHALEAASMANGMMDILNVKYLKKWGDDFKEVKAGIGVAYGRALTIKAGFKGSAINDLIYMGDVVNKASKMCDLAYKEYSGYPICVTQKVYVSAGTYIANSQTQKTFQDYLSERTHSKYNDVYVGNFYRISMRKWCDDNS